MAHHAPVVHREHHQVHHVVHEPHQPHHVVPHSAKLIKAPAPVHKFSGYSKPPHGATLEEIFHLQGGKYHAPEPAYHPPEPAYHPPEPAYHAPEPAYHAPEPAYHAPKPTYHHMMVMAPPILDYIVPTKP